MIQIPIAAFSFSFLVRARTVARTRLIHRHSLEARLFDFLDRGILSVRDIFMERGTGCLHEKGVWVVSTRRRYGLSPQERGVDTS